MTNAGFLLPAPGFHDACAGDAETRDVARARRDAHARRAPTPASPGLGLDPDFLTIGKSIAAGSAGRLRDERGSRRGDRPARGVTRVSGASGR